MRQGKRKPRVFTVGIFLVDRAYGGPEEGGWWFECAAPATEFAGMTKTFKHEEAADRYHDRLRKMIKDNDWNYGRLSISSVCSEGVYRAGMTRNSSTLKPWPKYWPHYE